MEEIRTEEELDEVLSRPSEELKGFLRDLSGDVAVLGAAGKMGPSLCLMLRRAFAALGRETRVLAVSRFTDASSRAWFQKQGVETLPCDLQDPEALNRLPKVPSVFFLAGRKFGSTGGESLTWAANTLVPGFVASHFRDSRIVALSTGCVYPLVSPATGGSKESDPPGPVGEYAQSCLGRERIFEHRSRESGTKVCLVRLNYAIELRYGVLADLASEIWAGRPVDLGMGYANVVGQDDALDRIIRALDLCASPPSILNLTGPETLRIRDLALALGRHLGREPRFQGKEAETALLSDASFCQRRFGPPRRKLEDWLAWTAAWVKAGGRNLGKPTHFQVRDGKF